LDHHESWSILDPDDNGIPPVVVDDGSDNEAGKDESGYATEDEIAPVQAPAPQIYQFNPVLSNHPLAVSFQLLNYDETPTNFLQLDQLFLQWHIPKFTTKKLHFDCNQQLSIQGGLGAGGI
jgi:hypothetical protein